VRDAGAIAFGNGKTSLASAKVMRNVLAYAKDFGALIVHHLEDPTLAKDGVMNEGEVATRLGLRGIPSAAETIILERDIRLVELTGSAAHEHDLVLVEERQVHVGQARHQGHDVDPAFAQTVIRRPGARRVDHPDAYETGLGP